jgi:hypothetical protein
MGALLRELGIRGLRAIDTTQCLNYLPASGRSVCLLVNFQKPKAKWKRAVHEFQIAGPLEPPVVAQQRYYTN